MRTAAKKEIVYSSEFVCSLAASSSQVRLCENSHPGYQASCTTPHEDFGLANSNTVTGFRATLPAARTRPCLSTYTRDSYTGLDYADQRYYASNYGRFNTADPYRASAGSSDPGSWNRYSYVQGDPVNLYDPEGLSSRNPDEDGDGGDETPRTPACPPDFQVPNQPPGCKGISLPGRKQTPKPTRPVDSTMNSLAGFYLSQRLSAFGGFQNSNCDKVLSQTIKGFSLQSLLTTAAKTNWYNATNPADAALTQNQVTGNGNGARLGSSIGYGDDAHTISGGPLGPAVILGANFFSNTDATYDSNVILHELIHAATGASDDDLFSAFAGAGLQNLDGGSGAISDWLSTDCTSTPSSH